MLKVSCLTRCSTNTLPCIALLIIWSNCRHLNKMDQLSDSSGGKLHGETKTKIKRKKISKCTVLLLFPVGLRRLSSIVNRQLFTKISTRLQEQWNQKPSQLRACSAQWQINETLRRKRQEKEHHQGRGWISRRFEGKVDHRWSTATLRQPNYRREEESTESAKAEANRQAPNREGQKERGRGKGSSITNPNRIEALSILPTRTEQFSTAAADACSLLLSSCISLIPDKSAKAICNSKHDLSFRFSVLSISLSPFPR